MGRKEKSFADKVITFNIGWLTANILLDIASTYISMGLGKRETGVFTPLPGILPSVSDLRNNGQNFRADLYAIPGCLGTIVAFWLIGRAAGPNMEAAAFTIFNLAYLSVTFTNLYAALSGPK